MTQGKPLFLDFETHYDRDYSLTKMSTAAYVADKRFEVLGFAYASGHGTLRFVTGTDKEMKQKLTELVAEHPTVVCHNVPFDGAILEWHYGLRPQQYFCTLAGARPYVVPYWGSASLAKCAEFLGTESKGEFIKEMIGKKRKDVTGDVLANLAIYARTDVGIMRQMYDWLMLRLPLDEQYLIHLTQLKFLRPRLQLDEALLQKAADDIDVAETKAELGLNALGLKRIDVTSNPRFAQHLINRGVTVPMKTSLTTGRPTFAFAKRDPDFIDLKSHPDPIVQLLVETRLLLKTSIERTRVAKFRALYDVTGGMLPVPLLYYGAHTGRFSGTGGFNLQNLPRGSVLRQAIRAPDEYVVVTVDLSAIEARITAALAGEWGLVNAFGQGEDVYSQFATVLYGYPVSKDDPNTKDERFIGKMCILGLGFGMGADKYLNTMASFGVEMTPPEAKRTVGVYREMYPSIPRLWRTMDGALSSMLELGKTAHRDMWLAPDREPMLRLQRGKVTLPNKMPLFYPNMSRGPNNNITYRVCETPTKQYTKPIWGGAFTENVVQALARIIISRAEIRLARAGLVSVMQVHDELVFVVPERAVDTIRDVVTRVVTDPVPWMPDLPIACEVGVGPTYGDAK